MYEFRQFIEQGNLPAIKHQVEVEEFDVNADLTRYFLGVPKGGEQNHWAYRPLHHAARLGNEDIAKYLVEQGADINSVNRLGNTPLHTAIYFAYAPEDGREPTKHYRVAKYLIQAGACLTQENTGIDSAGIQVVTERNMTILHYAAKWGNFELLQLILGSMPIAKIDSVNWEGKTALQLLMDRELDCDSVYHKSRHETYFNYVQKQAMICHLIEKEANFLKRTSNGDNILHLAIQEISQDKEYIQTTETILQPLRMLLEVLHQKDVSREANQEEPYIPRLLSMCNAQGLTPMSLAISNSCLGSALLLHHRYGAVLEMDDERLVRLSKSFKHGLELIECAYPFGILPLDLPTIAQQPVLGQQPIMWGQQHRLAQEPRFFRGYDDGDSQQGKNDFRF